MAANRVSWTGVIAASALMLAMAGCAAASRSPGMAAPDDPTLKTRIETALRNAPGVHPNEVTTEVVDGVAILSGSVHNQAEIDAAVAAARRVEGLKDVRSSLNVQ